MAMSTRNRDLSSLHPQSHCRIEAKALIMWVTSTDGKYLWISKVPSVYKRRNGYVLKFDENSGKWVINDPSDIQPPIVLLRTFMLPIATPGLLAVLLCQNGVSSIPGKVTRVEISQVDSNVRCSIRGSPIPVLRKSVKYVLGKRDDTRHFIEVSSHDVYVARIVSIGSPKVPQTCTIPIL
eukprot:Pgem_evm1s13305